MQGIAQAIRSRLEAALAPAALEVEDQSSAHVGHAGARPEGETHFRVRVVAGRFEGLSRVARQREVYAALDDLMNNPIHALSIEALSPEEAAEVRERAGRG